MKKSGVYNPFVAQKRKKIPWICLDDIVNIESQLSKETWRKGVNKLRWGNYMDYSDIG